MYVTIWFHCLLEQRMLQCGFLVRFINCIFLSQRKSVRIWRFSGPYSIRIGTLSGSVFITTLNIL